MFQKRISVTDIFRTVFLVCVLVSTLSADAGGFERMDDLCAAATPVDPGGSFRAYVGGPFSFKVAVPSAGLLSVDVASPAASSSGSASPQPTVGFVGRGCGTARADLKPLVVDRSATHLVLAVDRPGTYLFRVASQDRSRPLGDIKLRSGFAPDTGTGCGGEDEEIIEIEPDPLIFGGGGEDKEIIEIEPDPLVFPCGESGGNKEIIEIEPDPLIARGTGGRSLHAMLESLCLSGEADDHGDSFTCATFLAPNRRAAGEIGNGWGDDVDVFELVVGGSGGTELWSVEIEAGGNETSGVLYDRSGRRLETAVEGEAGFRIVRTLPSGTYFVRVEGRRGAEGPYTLSVAAAPW